MPADTKVYFRPRSGFQLDVRARAEMAIAANALSAAPRMTTRSSPGVAGMVLGFVGAWWFGLR